MKPVAKKATPAAIAVLRQATAIAPLRKKASDGLLPSKAHIHQNPNSDHNTGFGVDLTHDKLGGIDCFALFQQLKADKRVKYLIFQGKIWSTDRAKEGDRELHRFKSAQQTSSHLDQRRMWRRHFPLVPLAGYTKGCRKS
jgi:hypothetical protein